MPANEKSQMRSHRFRSRLRSPGGWRNDTTLTDQLTAEVTAQGVDVHAIGDCREVGLLEGAIKDAGQISRSI